jgi:hypothetical protein
MSNNSNKEIKGEQIPSRQNEDQTQRIAEGKTKYLVREETKK